MGSTIVEPYTYICVKSESWSQSNWEVCKQAHEETGQCGDGRSGSDEITTDLVYADEIRSICRTAVARRAHARAT
jgi:hypothetical protein